MSSDWTNRRFWFVPVAIALLFLVGFLILKNGYSNSDTRENSNDMSHSLIGSSVEDPGTTRLDSDTPENRTTPSLDDQSGGSGRLRVIEYDSDSSWVDQAKRSLDRTLAGLENASSKLKYIRELQDSPMSDRWARVQRAYGLAYLPWLVQGNPSLKEEAYQLVKDAASNMSDAFLQAYALSVLTGKTDGATLFSREELYLLSVAVGPIKNPSNENASGEDPKASFIQLAHGDKSVPRLMRMIIEGPHASRLWIKRFTIDTSARLETDAMIEVLSGFEYSSEGSIEFAVLKTLSRNGSQEALELLHHAENLKLQQMEGIPFVSELLLGANEWNNLVAERGVAFLKNEEAHVKDHLRAAAYLAEGLSRGLAADRSAEITELLLDSPMHPWAVTKLCKGVASLGDKTSISTLKKALETWQTGYRADAIKYALEELGWDHGMSKSIHGEIEQWKAKLNEQSDKIGISLSSRELQSQLNKMAEQDPYFRPIR